MSRKPRNNQDISHFLNSTDPFVVYFLGYFWADGTVRDNKPRMTFKIKRDDFEDIRPLVHRLGYMWHYREYIDNKHPNWSTLSVLDVQHQGLWKFLCDHDYQIKSGASADKILQHIPEHLRHYWWRGYFDGDGSISGLRDGELSFNSGMYQDWTFVHNIGKILDIDFTIERKDRGNRAGSKASISTWSYLKRFIEYMYQGEQFGLLRKIKRCESYLNSDRAKKPNLTSVYRGVSTDKTINKFKMQISCNGIYYSKRFENEEEAARAYDLKARELFGNKAIVNFAV